MSQQTSSVVLQLLPEDGDDLDNAWQEECQSFKDFLQRDLDTLEEDCELQPETRATESVEGENTRGIALQTFSELAVFLGEAGLAAQASTLIFSSLKNWLSERKGCSCKIVSSDGSTYDFNNLTSEQLMDLMLKTRKTD